MKKVTVSKSHSSSSTVIVKYCDTFFDKFIGLMFSKGLRQDNGVLLVNSGESTINASIHMFFMNFDITALWLDKNMVVVDKVVAKKWHPFYYPKKPAKYILELHHSQFPEYSIGDKLVFLNADDNSS